MKVVRKRQFVINIRETIIESFQIEPAAHINENTVINCSQ